MCISVCVCLGEMLCRIGGMVKSYQSVRICVLCKYYVMSLRTLLAH